MLTIMGQIMLDKSYFVKLLSKFFFFFIFNSRQNYLFFGIYWTLTEYHSHSLVLEIQQ